MKQDNRKHLAAFKPCGCCVLITTIEDLDMPPPFGPYRAGHDTIADFYREVARKTGRKRKPLTLNVVEIHGRPELTWQCAVCNPTLENAKP